MARFVTGRGFVRSRGFIARELNVGSALCIFYGAGSDRRTIYIYIYIYIQPYRLCGARSGSPQLLSKCMYNMINAVYDLHIEPHIR